MRVNFSETNILILLKKLYNKKFIPHEYPIGNWHLEGYRFEGWSSKNMITILYMGGDKELVLYEGKMSKYLTIYYHKFRLAKVKLFLDEKRKKEKIEVEEREQKLKELIDLIEEM
ncbi:MAG: hypothetical protein ACRC5M_00280 [Anaeroplasmataceae bacterium]